MRTGHVASFPGLHAQLVSLAVRKAFCTASDKSWEWRSGNEATDKTIVVSDIPQPTVNRSLVFSISPVHVNSSPTNGVQTCL